MPRTLARQSVAIMEGLMDEAVNSGNLSPYPLAFFNAMLYEDPTVVAWREQNDYVVPGLNNCDDELWDFCEMAVFSSPMQKWKKELSDLL